MTAVTIDDVYKLVSDVEANKKNGEESKNDELFTELLSSTKGDTLIRRLASQMIAKLFKDFPIGRREEAYEAMISMIEDEDINIRKQVASDLPKLCKDATEFIPKVTDILVQMLQSNDVKEQTLVNSSLMQILNIDSIEALRGIFGQIFDSEVKDSARLRALALLAKRLHQVQLPKLSQLFVEREVLAIMDDATQREFVDCVQILISLPCMQCTSGRQKIIDKILDEINYLKPINTDNSVAIATAIECLLQAKKCLSKDTRVDRYMSFLLQNILPVINSIVSSANDHNPRLDLLQAMADFASFSGSGTSVTPDQLNNLFNYLKLLLPLSASQEADGNNQIAVNTQWDYDFSQIECILYIAYRMINNCEPSAYSGYLSEMQPQLKSLKSIAEIYQESLISHHEEKHGLEELQVLRKPCITLLANIITMCNELSKAQPYLKLHLNLSWQPVSEMSTRKRKMETNGTGAVSGRRIISTSDSFRRNRRVFRR